jgi:hypothetical protein
MLIAIQRIIHHDTRQGHNAENADKKLGVGSKLTGQQISNYHAVERFPGSFFLSLQIVIQSGIAFHELGQKRRPSIQKQ